MKLAPRRPLLRAVITDGDATVRRALRCMLHKHPDVDVVGAGAKATRAVAMLAEKRADVLFAGTRSGDNGAFDTVRLPVPRPIIVAMSDRPEDAVRAFELGAVDYLLKPFDEARVDEAVARALELVRLRRAGLSSAVAALLPASPLLRRPTRIAIRTGRSVVLLDTSAIDRVDADNKMVRIRAGSTSYETRRALGELEELLEIEGFLRVSRSTIINIDRVAEIQPWARSEYVIVLRDGYRVTTTRTYRDRVERLFL